MISEPAFNVSQHFIDGFNLFSTRDEDLLCLVRSAFDQGSCAEHHKGRPVAAWRKQLAITPQRSSSDGSGPLRRVTGQLVSCCRVFLEPTNTACRCVTCAVAMPMPLALGSSSTLAQG